MPTLLERKQLIGLKLLDNGCKMEYDLYRPAEPYQYFKRGSKPNAEVSPSIPGTDTSADRKPES